MLTWLKTAYGAVTSIENIWRYLLVALFLGGVIGGAWAIYHGQAKTISTQAEAIQNSAINLGKAEVANTSLTAKVAELKEQRDDAQTKYSNLDAMSRSNKAKLEVEKQKNEDLQKRIIEIQANDPGANSRVPDDVIRLHQQAIREFNAKYGSSGGAVQAGDPARTDVLATTG